MIEGHGALKDRCGTLKDGSSAMNDSGGTERRDIRAPARRSKTGNQERQAKALHRPIIHGPDRIPRALAWTMAGNPVLPS